MKALATIHQQILQTLADPNAALAFLFFGVAGIYAEFCAPGRVFPGVAGAMLVILAIAGLRQSLLAGTLLLQIHFILVLALTTFAAAATIFLLRIAARARRNKISQVR